MNHKRFRRLYREERLPRFNMNALWASENLEAS